MGKMHNLVMSLVGLVGGGTFVAVLVLSGVLTKLTGLPVLPLVAVILAGGSAAILAIGPIGMALLGGGTKTAKPKKAKKAKGKKAAAAAPEDDDFEDAPADMGEDEFDDYSDSFDSVAESEMSTDFGDFADDEVSESSVAGMIDESGAATMSEDDPFDISDSFESGVEDLDLASSESEAFDDAFDLDDDEKA